VKKLRTVAVATVLIAAVLFTVGVSVEKSHHTETNPTTPSSALAAGEAGETGHTDETPSAAAAAHSETGGAEGQVLGINVETPGVTALAVLASAVVAGLVWLWPRRAVWALTLVFVVAFAVFDVAEIAHQTDRSETRLAVLAVVVLALHAAAAVAAIVVLRSRAVTPTTDALQV
jgi:hypothetical protein